MRTEKKRLKEREKRIFDALGEHASGKYAIPVYRERATGHKRDLKKEEEAKSEYEKAKAEEEAKKKAELEKISKGLKQNQDQKANLDDYLLEASKPFARYEDDDELDKLLREKELEGDPMLEYFRQKKIKEGDSKEGVKKFRGPASLNRFNIVPGHRWDGVDRSNGFERRWFEKIAEKEAIKEEAYRWATDDM